MIKILDHPLAQNDLSIIRSKNTDTVNFRSAAYRIGLHLAIESTKELELEGIEIETPLEKTSAVRVRTNVVIIPILRAGLALIQPFQDVYPECEIGYIGMKRDENTYEAYEYYYSVPKIEPSDKVILLELMLATGISASNAIDKLRIDGVEDITLVSIISAPEGIEKIRAGFPKVKIISASLDRGLNEKKYILPGLGDAGDRYSGYTTQ